MNKENKKWETVPYRLGDECILVDMRKDYEFNLGKVIDIVEGRFGDDPSNSSDVMIFSNGYEFKVRKRGPIRELDI